MDGAVAIFLQQQPPPPTLSGSGHYVVLGLAAAFIVYVAILRPMFARRRDPLAGGSPVRFGLTQQKALERDMQNLLVELHEMARQMTAQIETRAAKLEILIREADEKLAQLDRATRATAAALDGAPPPPDAPPPPPTLRLVPAEPPNIEPADDRWDEVYRLADAGHDARSIAGQLKRPTGEVELILAIRPLERRPAPAASTG